MKGVAMFYCFVRDLMLLTPQYAWNESTWDLWRDWFRLDLAKYEQSFYYQFQVV
jgi:hypothetical protein